MARLRARANVYGIALLTAPLWVLPGLYYIIYTRTGWRYWYRQAIAADQRINAWIGGDPDETLSSRAWRAQLQGREWGLVAVRLIDALLGRGHCQSSFGV